MVAWQWNRFVKYIFALQALTYLLALVLLMIHVDCQRSVDSCRESYYALLATTALLVLLFLPPLPGPRAAMRWLRQCVRRLGCARCCGGDVARVGGSERPIWSQQLDADVRQSTWFSHALQCFEQ